MDILYLGMKAEKSRIDLITGFQKGDPGETTVVINKDNKVPKTRHSTSRGGDITMNKSKRHGGSGIIPSRITRPGVFAELASMAGEI